MSTVLAYTVGMEKKKETITTLLSENESIQGAIFGKIRASGLTQSEIARQLGLKPQALGRALRNGGKIPPIWSRVLDYFDLELTVKKKGS